MQVTVAELMIMVIPILMIMVITSRLEKVRSMASHDAVAQKKEGEEYRFQETHDSCPCFRGYSLRMKMEEMRS